MQMLYEAVKAGEKALSEGLITARHLALYRILVDLSRPRAGRAFCSRRWLAAKLKVTERTIDRWVAALIAAGLVERRHVFCDRSGWQTANSWYITAMRTPEDRPRHTVRSEKASDARCRPRVTAVSPPMSNRSGGRPVSGSIRRTYRPGVGYMYGARKEKKQDPPVPWPRTPTWRSPDPVDEDTRRANVARIREARRMLARR